MAFRGGDPIVVESDKKIKIKIEGEGHLINKDLNKQFPVKFEVKQIHTGEISGTCTLSGFKYEDVLSPSQLEKCRCISGGLIKVIVDEMQEYILENFRNSSIEGETKNQDGVVIKNIFTYGCTIKHSDSILDLKFSAGKVEVSYEKISTKDQLQIEYGIINLDLRYLLHGHIETDIGKITFSKWNHEEIIEEMETFKTPLLSGFLNITGVNIGKFESVDSYLKTADETIGKILELLSLAQSTYLSHCLIRVYAKTPNSNSHDDYELKRMVMLDIKTKTPSLGQPLIRDWEDIYKFISTTLPKYTDDLREGFDLGIALEWYLESLSHGVLQSEYLLACTCLELLKGRHNKMVDNEFIIRPKRLFDKKGYKYLKNKTSGMLKEIGINEDHTEHENIKKEIDENLISINRTSFKNSLSRLLYDLHISYDDIFPNIKVIPKIRNQITHRGTQEISPEELFDIYEKLICLIQRIFLALLEYDGYFLDRDDNERKKFTDFITDKSEPIRR